MSVHVNEFLRKKGKNDLQYIELLEDTLENQKEITGKAVAKIRELEKENKEIRSEAVDDFLEQIKEYYNEKGCMPDIMFLEEAAEQAKGW